MVNFKILYLDKRIWNFFDDWTSFIQIVSKNFNKFKRFLKKLLPKKIAKQKKDLLKKNVAASNNNTTQKRLQTKIYLIDFRNFLTIFKCRLDSFKVSKF